MKCFICGTEMETKPTDVETGWGQYRVVIKGIKTHVCSNCGERAYEQKDVRMMQKISAALSESESEEKPDVLNVEEVADLLRVSTQTIYNMIRDGRLPAKKVGREWRFSRKQIQRLLEAEEDTTGTEEIALAARAKDGVQLSDNDLRIIQKYQRKLIEEAKQEGGD